MRRRRVVAIGQVDGACARAFGDVRRPSALPKLTRTHSLPCKTERQKCCRLLHRVLDGRVGHVTEIQAHPRMRASRAVAGAKRSGSNSSTTRRTRHDRYPLLRITEVCCMSSAARGGARDLAAPEREGVCALACAPMNPRHPREPSCVNQTRAVWSVCAPLTLF